MGSGIQVTKIIGKSVNFEVLSGDFWGDECNPAGKDTFFFQAVSLVSGGRRACPSGKPAGPETRRVGAAVTSRSVAPATSIMVPTPRNTSW